MRGRQEPATDEPRLMTASRRNILFLLVMLGVLGPAPAPALAKDGDGGGDGGDSDGGGGDSGAGDDGDDGDTDKKGDKNDDGEEADRDRIRDAVSRGSAEPLSHILSRLRKRYPGEFVRVRLIGKGESLHYRIRILQSDGRRIEVRVDAMTGRIMRVDD